MELEIKPTNKESRMEDCSSKKNYTAADIEKQMIKDNAKTSTNLIFIGEG